jgi:hypothetical protein
MACLVEKVKKYTYDDLGAFLTWSAVLRGVWRYPVVTSILLWGRLDTELVLKSLPFEFCDLHESNRRVPEEVGVADSHTLLGEVEGRSLEACKN